MHWQGGCSLSLVCLFSNCQSFIFMLLWRLFTYASTSCVPFFFSARTSVFILQGQSFSQSPVVHKVLRYQRDFFYQSSSGEYLLVLPVQMAYMGKDLRSDAAFCSFLKTILIPPPPALLLRPFLHTCPFLYDILHRQHILLVKPFFVYF